MTEYYIRGFVLWPMDYTEIEIEIIKCLEYL